MFFNFFPLFPQSRIHRVLSHWKLFGIVLALSSLDLPGYVLLWISDWLPPHCAETEFKRITLITNVINSIRRAKSQTYKE
jgi:hypothetical protein